MTKIKSAQFVKGAVGPDSIFNDMRPQIAFIGRSNVGKSSIINSLTGQNKLAKISSLPGRTREINLFLINDSFYLIDLPGYGYAKLPKDMRIEIEKLINWYLFLSGYEQKKIFLIIDAKVGPTKDDLEILQAFREHNKNIVIVVNKIDKVKSSEKDKQIKKIKDSIGECKIILCSTKSNIGIPSLLEELMQ
ncbi:YihA family ribosome biogenesis GTP-binding protein [Candidatus Falkowbacteria bacterium HGW-Falkowbacteria-1]|jgi:GTP-binding protein|uniref:Probable GTP-binding protein EngB n=1 Tax=Candidatus Falkowbacteria bacterium HGW-Falkowbacteria-1 TaxID=2013768 RepID=A0A2N2E9I1_9BACT|nr:MAG: YihA family ribosome biogenesis GTP-binding protein [Candidatus Falkowbacteria bacterium HGW-Falkowbacteria-1]